MENKNIKSNLWKLFLISVCNRRHYLPILSIFFLTLPNTHAQQIGLYTAIGYIAGFLLEIPSGYISDKIGHKKAIIISGASMMLSTIFYIYATSLTHFIIGSILISTSIAFNSGTFQAFTHNTLIELKREKDFAKILGKISGNAALVSVFLLVTLPFLTKISILLPIKINLILDVIGLIIALILISPKEKIEAEDEEPLPMLKQLKKWKGTGFYSLSLLTGLIAGIFFSSAPFRSVYLENIGLPIIYLGFVSGLSRFIWFLGGNSISKLKEKLNFKSLMKLDIFITTLSFTAVAFFNNPYVVATIFALSLGYFWSRMPIVNEYFLNHFTHNKKLKATMLSVKGQISYIIQFTLAFTIGYFMKMSYKLGNYIFAGIALLLGTIFYMISRKHLTK